MSTSGALVTCEVALALALGVAAVLMAQSLNALHRVELGFDPSGVIAARVSLPPDRYPSDQAQRAFFDTLLDRVRLVPGVQAGGEMSARPLSGLGPATTVRDPSARAAGRPNEPVADVRTIGGDVIRVLGLRILEGRSLNGTLANGAPEIIVTADLAERLWPGTTAVGRTLSVDMYGGVTGTVVGVIAPVHLFDPRTPARPALFLSSSRFAGPQQDVLVRSSSPNVVVAELRTALAAIDHSIPLYRVSTLSALAADALAADRFATFLLCAFAASALALTAVGVFGVCSADVAARRREIGIRIALGSTRAQILAAAAVRTLRRAAVGVSCGLAGALILARTMRALLFDVQPTDVPSFLAVGTLILVIALTATLVPAARALRRHPLEALREE
jgi:putative ABC transport system permease protein